MGSKKYSNDYEIEHRGGKSIRQAGCMSRLKATTLSVNKITITAFDPSGNEQANSSSQHLPPSNSQTPPAQQSKTSTIPSDTDEQDQTGDEQSEVKEGYEPRASQDNPTVISSVRQKNATNPN